MNSQLRAEPPAATPAADGARGTMSATVVRPALPRYVLRGVSGAGFGRTFPLLGATVLGRGHDCGIHLDHPGVSRQHVRLTPTDEGLLVEDLGSTNGWLLNEVPQQRAWARHGDELGIDALRFRVIAPGVAGASKGRRGRRMGPGGARVSTWWWAVAGAVLLGAAAVFWP